MATKKLTKPKPQVPAVVGKKEALILIQDDIPDFLAQRAIGAGRGSEEVGTEDLVIPRLEIVQALSPAVKEGDPGYIENARMGMLNNSVTRTLYGNSVMVVPVHYTKQWLVWRDRKAEVSRGEGGFFGAFPNIEEATERADQEGGKAKGIIVIDTPQHLCLLVNPHTGEVEEIMISMPRTKAKISRQWNSMIKLAGGDRFARVYRVGTQLQKNPKGDFYNFTVAQSGFPHPKLFKKAEDLYNKIAAGERRVVMDTSHMEPEATPPDGDEADM